MMKNIYLLLTLVFLSFISETLTAQAPPQKMTYQFVARNAQNQLIQNNAVGLRISILQGSPTGTAVYVETHTPQTNGNGTATIEVGGGTVVSGVFANINWSTGVYFIQTEMDPQGQQGYSVTAVSQLLTVPYAFYAAISTRSTIADSVVGGMSETDPSFNASLAAGITPSDTARWNQDLVDDADSDPTNELQTLSVVGDTIFLSNGGGSAVLPTGNTGITHHVGQNFGGGIVFHVYLDSLGEEHGLIVSMSDLGFTEWGLYGTNVVSCESDWDGLSNSNAALNAGGGLASSLCYSYNYGGFNDWYLPSILELQKLYTGK